ncbi:acetolactate synthase [Candidatus Gastranaerophilus sp. (ex Termes propinquus)]|nr:acetolactate synthase [Candidatus Gastranaerophilus sp. (ex Termes propinquus)]
MSEIKLSDYIARRLREHYGVKCVFMITGGGAMHLNDSMGRHIPYICNHHEQASSFGAEGFAKTSRELAVVSVTTGPGGLNCLNGVFGQWTDSVPVLYISGQVKRQTALVSYPETPLRQLGDQEVDIINTVKPLTKYAALVLEPYDIKYHLDKAIHEALSGRQGPVWLDVPIDVQSTMIEEDSLKEFTPPKAPVYDLKIDEVAEKLNAAKRPLIVLGHGIRLSGTESEISKFKVPTVTTLNGFDLMEDENPNYIGRIGTIGQRAGNFALQNADVVLCLGTRNNIRQVSYQFENFAKNAFKIVVDIDPAELQKPTVKPDLAVCADLKNFLPKMPPITATKEWLEFCSRLKLKYAPDKENRQDGDKINPYCFLNTLTDSFLPNTTCILANGSATVCTFQVAKVKQGLRYILNSGNASMGFALPAAIGVACAGAKNVVCIEGDGSIMMNLQELQTVVHHAFSIKIFVLNNQGYSSIKQTQANFFNGHLTGADPKSGVSMPDFCEVARAFGLKTVKISNVGEISAKIKEVLKAQEPVLCEVLIDPDSTFAPKLSAKRLEDGTLVSPSLEDMFPFLPREEFEECMPFSVVR